MQAEQHPGMVQSQIDHPAAYQFPSPAMPIHDLTAPQALPKTYSISINPRLITATAAPAASFLPPNRKRLEPVPRHPSESCASRFRSWLTVTRSANGASRGEWICGELQLSEPGDLSHQRGRLSLGSRAMLADVALTRPRREKHGS